MCLYGLGFQNKHTFVTTGIDTHVLTEKCIPVCEHVRWRTCIRKRILQEPPREMELEGQFSLIQNRFEIHGQIFLEYASGGMF